MRSKKAKARIGTPGRVRRPSKAPHISQDWLWSFASSKELFDKCKL
jgi:hypothetical protein